METNTTTTHRTYEVKDAAQRKALTSPIRLEILGHFTGKEALSVAEIGVRMGRPPTAIYYHVHQLEEVGLLVRAGSRGSGKKEEALYRPVAERFDLTPDHDDPDQWADTVVTTTAAYRMAVRDMQAALEEKTGRHEGPDRNFYASRMHARLSPADLARVNDHLNALTEIFMQTQSDDASEGDFCSLTVAIMPLRGRQGSE